MSSLEKQLKRLRIPDSSSLERATKFKKRTSFLFDPKEACDIDNETVYALALNGLDELKLVNEHFEIFEDTLFNESSKQVERNLQSKEVNEKLDDELKKYLQFLSPYILLKPAHKTLEWLIRRFQIHLHNIDDLLACVFPYHQSNVFARVVQLLNIVNTKWSWLISVQKTGSPLPRSTIIQHCLSNPGFLTFISGLVFSLTKDKKHAVSAALPVCSSFYASTVFGVLESIEKVSEEIISILLNPIIQGLKSTVKDLQAASYMIIGQLSTKCTLESSVIESLLKTMCKNTSLPESMLMCIGCLCSSHSLNMFPKKVFLLLCKLPNMATLLCELSNNYEMDSFLKTFLPQLIKAVLRHDDEEDNKEELSCVLINLLRDVKVDDVLKVDITRNMFLGYIEMRRTCGNESERIAKLHNDIKSPVRIIQNRWQSQIDQTVQDYLVNLQKDKKKDNDVLEWTQDFVSMALSNVGSQVVRESGTTLILALHHPQAEYRKLALKKVSSILKEPVDNMKDKEFLKESLLVKLGDNDPSVVLTVLKLNEGLINICHGEELTTSLFKLLENASKKWMKVFEKALAILLSDKLLATSTRPADDNILFHLIPLVFLTKNNVDCPKLIIDHLSKSQLTSEWMMKSLQKRSLKKVVEKCTEAESTSQELAIANTMLIYSMAENIALLGNEHALQTMQTMKEHMKQANQTFVLIYLIISIQLLTVTNDDIFRFDILSTVLPELLPLVKQVTETKLKRVKQFDETSVQLPKNCGIVPFSLIANYITALKKNSSRRVEQVKSSIYLYCLQHVITSLPVHQSQLSSWWTVDDDSGRRYTEMLLTIFEVLLYGLSKGQNFVFQQDFQSSLQTVIKVQFPKKVDFLKFLTYLWCNATRRSIPTEQCSNMPSALAIIQSLHIAQILLKSLDDDTTMDMMSDHSQVIPSLLVCLTSPVMAVRQTVLQTISVIVSRPPTQTAAVRLCTLLCESSQEITADEAFIISVLQRYISSDSSERRKSKSKKSRDDISPGDVLEYILNQVVNEDTPSHVVRVLLTLLSKVATKSFVLKSFPVMKSITKNYLKNQDCSSDHSQILLSLITKLTPQTASLFKSEPELFNVFLQLLTFSKPFFTGHITPQEAVLNQMSAEFLESFTEERIQNELLGKLIDVLMETSDPKISTKLKEAVNMIPLSANQIHMELTKLAENNKEKNRKTKKQKTVISDDWYASLGSFWQRLVIIIELLQTKDNISQPEILLPTLFKILAMCLDITEETSSDYLRQLVLSTILKIFTAHVDQGNVITRGVLSEEHFSVEQIIHCIRVSGNPQTHHHALSLLAIGAQLFPEKVLHNIMSIFTFMGVNVLRQDDTYSFQVIQNTVEAVIPALIQAEQNKQSIQSLVTKVLRVFVDAFPHVPEHRRLPIFLHLLTTLGTSNYLHVCLALLLEKTRSHDETVKINTKDSLLFCHSLCNDFSPETQMISLIHLIKYLSSLPDEKPQGYRKRHADPSGIIFDMNSHSEKDLHLFKLSGIDLVLNVLQNENLIEKISQLSSEDQDKMGRHYLSLLEESLKYITSISRLLESSHQETTTKYLRVLLRKIYNVVEKIGDLLPRPTFINIVSQLIHNDNQTIRKKAMELFNKRMSAGTELLSEKQIEMLLVLLDSIIKLLQNEEEIDVNKQSAFNTVIVLSKLLGDTQSLQLKKVFTVAIAAFSKTDTKPQVASSALRCLAELCSVLKAHIIPFLAKFIPAVLKIIEMNDNETRSDVLLLNALTVIHKVVQVLPNFISPYLRKILTQLVSPTFIQSNVTDEKSSWQKQIADRAANLRSDLGLLIKPRILIPNVSQCYDEVVLNGNSESVIVLFHVVGKCVVNLSNEDVKNYNNQLLSLFISALDYRSRHGQGISEDLVLKTEEGVINAFLDLVMRLSESLFRPMFLKLVDWATRSPSTKLRLLAFYHLVDRMAEQLKGLFVLFAGYTTKNAASVLDSNNIGKTDKLFFIDNEANEVDEKAAIRKSCQLLHYILDCLHKCFLYDNQRFVNKERFDRLLKPLVDQIDNEIGASEAYHERINDHLAPCLAQFAVAAGDESYWKQINHHVCLKTRNSSSQVRLGALKVIQELNKRLGDEYLTLLPEIIPFLAELMEDEYFEVEQRCQQLISEIENVLGESLQKYF